MKTEKILAIVGAVIILISFFLPWQLYSFMGVNVKISAWGIATGSPGGSFDANPLDQLSNESGFSDLFFGSSFNDGADSITNFVEKINQALSQPVFFIIPAAAVFIILFSLLGPKKPHISFGLMLIGVSVILMIFTGVMAKKIFDTNNLFQISWGILDEIGLTDVLPKASLDIGVWTTVFGLLLILVAGILGWRAASQSDQTPAYVQAGNYQQSSQFNTKHNSQPSGFSSQNQQQNTWQQQSQPQQQNAWQQPSQPQQQTAWQSQSPTANWSQPAQESQSYSNQPYDAQYNQSHGNQPQNPPQQFSPSAPPPKSQGQQHNTFSEPLSDNPVKGWRTIKKPGDQPPES